MGNRRDAQWLILKIQERWPGDDGETEPVAAPENIMPLSVAIALTDAPESGTGAFDDSGDAEVPYDTQLATLAEMLAAEYKRGCEDTVARLMKAAGGPLPTREAALPLTAPPGNLQRAPRGSARILIERALEEAGTTGATTYGIASKATTDFEKMVSISAIRNELKNGERERRYRQVGGVWYFAHRAPTMKVVG
jgi:hypothetical protein